MHEALLDWKIWDALSGSEREAVARGVESLLPPMRGLSTHGYNEGGELRLTLRRVARFEAAGEAHAVAQFQLGDAPILFSLVPGGEVELGQAPIASHFSPAEIEQWRRWQELDGFPPLEEHLRDCLTPPRIVRLQPYLIECVPIGLEERSGLPEGGFQIMSADHEEAIGIVSATGFRLASRDQWEHAFSGGSRAMFPAWSQDETGRKIRAWGLEPMGGDLWGEFTGEPDVMRAGDGGVTACGGWGGILERLLDAPAFMSPTWGEGDHMAFRRVLPLDAD